MLSDIERKNTQREIEKLTAGIETSQASGLGTNAKLLTARRCALQERLAADDRERLRMHRRSAVVQDGLLSKALAERNEKAAILCEKALTKVLGAAGEIARRIEKPASRPAANLTPATTGPGVPATPAAASPVRPVANGNHDDLAGWVTDLRTGERVRCDTMNELRSRVLGIISSFGPAPTFSSLGFGNICP